MRDRQAAMGEVEADRRHHREAELALPVDGIAAGERLAAALRQPRSCTSSASGTKSLQESLELGEHRRDVGGAIAGIVLLHQRVVGIEPERRRRAAPPPRAPARRRLRAPAGSRSSRSWRAGRATAARSACAPASGARRTPTGRQVMLVYCRRNSRDGGLSAPRSAPRCSAAAIQSAISGAVAWR